MGMGMGMGMGNAPWVIDMAMVKLITITHLASLFVAACGLLPKCVRGRVHVDTSHQSPVTSPHSPVAIRACAWSHTRARVNRYI